MSRLPGAEECLLPSRFIDSGHPEVEKRATSLVNTDSTPRENALSLYYWTRDQIRYNPYAVGTEPDDFLASTTLRSGQGWCVTKAILLAALCRAAGIPARVGFADVRNHLSTARLRESMGTDVFYFHGYTSILLDGKWVKATPAFNIELCSKFGLRPLEFDGIHDSLYHEFDVAGNRHMEYLRERGEHLDLPYEEMRDLFVEKYPNMFKPASTKANGLPDSADWDADVDLETRDSAV
jgi:transglutaminase-like putative cysteine protease